MSIQPIEEKWKETMRQKWEGANTGGHNAISTPVMEEILVDIENLLEQEREKSSDAKFHFTNGVLEERKRMSEKVKGRKSKLSYGAYTTQDAKVFWEGKDAAFDEVLSIINK